ncbi:unnamed protein product [Amoebophrya sp. A25]|nr:unnamed protein product [Amoebophrya sp. A25]|eukprot:GSA25T00005504001.1
MRRLFTKESADKFAFGCTGIAASVTAYHYWSRGQEQVDKMASSSGGGDKNGASKSSSSKYRFDPARSKLNFSTSHWGFTVHGKFTNFEGTFITSSTSAASGGKEEDVHDDDTSKATSSTSSPALLLEITSIDTAVRADSIDTQNWLRDRRMRNEFLEADKFPLLTFHSSSAGPVVEGSQATLTVRPKVLEPSSEEAFADAVSSRSTSSTPDGAGRICWRRRSKSSSKDEPPSEDVSTTNTRHASRTSQEDNKNPEQLYRASGTVTIRDIPKVIDLDVRVLSVSAEEIVATVSGELDRYEFDILTNWPALAVGQKVGLDFHLVAQKVELKN